MLNNIKLLILIVKYFVTKKNIFFLKNLNYKLQVMLL